MTMPDLQLLKKLCLINYEEDISVYIFENLLFSVMVSLKKSDSRISTRGNIQEVSQLNTFRTRKMTISSTLLIRRRFQRYCCESDNAICNGEALKIRLTVPMNPKILQLFEITLNKNVMYQYKILIDGNP